MFLPPLWSRLDCEDGQEPEVQPLPTETDLLSQEEGQEDNTEGTKTEEPNTSQLGPNKCEYQLLTVKESFT